ncbi:MAG TPA: hypothetical protein VKB80_22410 [Kofleriaceae bacterium]|nr:hypothetical protein [Kofleriaceae bacterium]
MRQALTVTAAILVLAGARAAADPPAQEIEAGGHHVRLVTARGPVHVWTPAGYRQERAGIAFYVHGYYTGVDRAWTEHRLAEQFRASGRNALFIAPEAPAGGGDQVSWPLLGQLLVEVRRQTGLLRPWGPVVVLAHSGGYRTAEAWLEHRALEQVVLIDALYGDEDAYRAWLAEPRGGPANQLLLVGGDTIRWTEPFVRELGGGAAGTTVRVFDRLPDRAAEVGDDARRAPVLYFRSQIGHMELVEGGRTIPLLLQLTRLPAIR